MTHELHADLVALQNTYVAADSSKASSNIVYDDGTYDMLLTSMELGRSSGASKRLQVTSKFKFMSGIYEGKDLWHFDGIDTETGLSYFKALCETIGLDLPPEMVDMPDAIKEFMDSNKNVIVSLQLKTGKNKKTGDDIQNSYIKGLLNVE